MQLSNDERNVITILFDYRGYRINPASFATQAMGTSISRIYTIRDAAIKKIKNHCEEDEFKSEFLKKVSSGRRAGTFRYSYVPSEEPKKGEPVKKESTKSFLAHFYKPEPKESNGRFALLSTEEEKMQRIVDEEKQRKDRQEKLQRIIVLVDFLYKELLQENSAHLKSGKHTFYKDDHLNKIYKIYKLIEEYYD
jgi:hypothetical protein